MKSVFGAMVWKLGERGISQIIALIVQIILARILLTDDFGILAILMVFISLGEVLVQRGIVSSLIRKKDAESIDFDTAFIFCEAIALLVFLLLFVLSPLVERFYQLLGLATYLRIISISLFFGALFSIDNAIFVRKMQFNKVFVCSLTSNVSAGTVAIVIALSGGGVWALITYTLLQRVVMCLIGTILVDWRPRIRFSKESFKSMFSFGSNVLISEILYVLIEDSRTLILGKKFSANDLAYYDRGQLYPSVMMRGIYDAIASVFLPVFSQQQEDKKELSKSIVKVISGALFFIMPIFIGWICVADHFVLVLLTSKWSPIIGLLRIFCIYQLVLPVYCIFRQSLYAIGKGAEVLRLEIAKGVLFVTAVVIGCQFSSDAVAIATTIAMYISMFSYAVYSWTIYKFKVNEIIKSFVRTGAYCLAMALVVFCVHCLPLSNIYLLASEITAGAVTYISLALIFKDPFLRNFVIRIKEKVKKK